MSREDFIEIYSNNSKNVIIGMLFDTITRYENREEELSIRKRIIADMDNGTIHTYLPNIMPENKELKISMGCEENSIYSILVIEHKALLMPKGEFSCQKQN